MNKSENKWRSKKFTQKYFLPLTRPKTYAIISLLGAFKRLNKPKFRRFFYFDRKSPNQGIPYKLGCSKKPIGGNDHNATI